jgi:hypothetical protein
MRLAAFQVRRPDERSNIRGDQQGLMDNLGVHSL